MNAEILRLRATLAANLRRLIRRPAVEAKELAAFDLLMTRRAFLNAAQMTAVGALVQSALPPTAWGKADPDLAVSANEVGLTAADESSVLAASQLQFGSELFTDSIYAQPVISPQEPLSHALIEGVRMRPRIQSDLSSTDPTELDFLDTDFHFGEMELIQIEEVDTDEYELVHYYYPLSGRTDGAKTDGLIRQVIVGTGVLTNPTKVLAVTGANSNKLVASGTTLTNTCSYMVYVECDNGTDENLLMIGTSTQTLEAPYDSTSSDYPITWVSHHSGSISMPWGSGYVLADKYSDSGMTSDTTYDPTQASEHIIINTSSGYLTVCSLCDSDPDNITLVQTKVPISYTNTRVIHIEWDNELDDGVAKSPSSVVTIYNDSGDMQTWKQYGPTLDTHDTPFGSSDVQRCYYTMAKSQEESNKGTSNTSIFGPNYKNLRTVQNLFTSTPVEGSTRHVKLVNLQGQALAVVVLNYSSGDTWTQIEGCFPLVVPDAAGIGSVVNLSGGMTKFGGYRFLAHDDEGNVFLLRQQRLAESTSPYGPPIYVYNDSVGATKTFTNVSKMSFPSTLASDSNLRDVDEYRTTLDGEYNYFVFNLLLNTALGFCTDDTGVAQATWLGNSYSAAYAPHRYAHDSEHVVVKQTEQSGSTEYTAYARFNQPVTKTWHTRAIASQTLPTSPGEELSGEFYHVTITPQNAYGRSVPLSASENDGVQIEVRADAPCMVVDEGTNLYHDVDRYTSFLSAPTNASSDLDLAIQADVFSQVLYARLVNADELSPSSSDSGMTSGSAAIVSDWATVNVALQAQQRMSTTEDSATSTTSTTSTSAQGAQLDTNVYVSGTTIESSQSSAGWQTKGTYEASTANFQGLASYFNTSGDQLQTASQTMTEATSSSSVDPLSSVTMLQGNSASSTTSIAFAYDAGTITSSSSSSTSSTLASAASSSQELGSVWGSISHDLHDALQYLQNQITKDAYEAISTGVTIAFDAAQYSAVTVGADIMKAVNGVDTALVETVETVEELGSVIENLVLTVIEHTFLYEFIEAMIELISLFYHLEDIQKLSTSLKDTFLGMFSDGTMSSSVSSPGFESVLSPYIGPGNTMSSAMGSVDTDDVADAITQTVMDFAQGNPLTKKILSKISNAVMQAVDDEASTLPLSFDMDATSVSDIASTISAVLSDLEAVVVNVTDDVMTFLVTEVEDDIADPKATFQNFQSGLGSALDEIVSDAVDPFYTLLETLLDGDSSYVYDALSEDAYVTLNLSKLIDFMSILGVGTKGTSSWSLSGSEAIFFPLAVVTWCVTYAGTGKSISSIGDLSSVSAELGASVSSSTASKTYSDASIAAPAIVLGVGELVWAAIQSVSSDDTDTETLSALGAWCAEIKALGSLSFATYSKAQGWTVPDWTLIIDFIRAATATAGIYFTWPGKDNNEANSSGLKPTDVVLFLNALCAACFVGAYTAETVSEDGSDMTTAEIEKLVGGDLLQVPTLIRFFYRILAAGDSPPDPDVLAGATIVMVGSTTAGAYLQISAESS